MAIAAEAQGPADDAHFGGDHRQTTTRQQSHNSHNDDDDSRCTQIHLDGSTEVTDTVSFTCFWQVGNNAKDGRAVTFGVLFRRTTERSSPCASLLWHRRWRTSLARDVTGDVGLRPIRSSMRSKKQVERLRDWPLVPEVDVRAGGAMRVSPRERPLSSAPFRSRRPFFCYRRFYADSSRRRTEAFEVRKAGSQPTLFCPDFILTQIGFEC